MKYEFDVASDLYVAGKTEDGEDYTAEVYYVTATAEDGTRYRHKLSFAGCSVERDTDDDGFPVNFFMDIREFAMEEANRIIARIVAAGGVIDLLQWWPMDSVYGSAAYVRNDEEGDQAARERNEG
jgi:hypothetical protein